MEKKDFPALTGIRFIAASFVYAFHYAPVLYAGKPLDFGYYLLHQLNIGVNLFFVLSGFLITHRYYSQSVTGGGFWLYWCKRIVRILPLYYAVLAFQFGMFYQQHNRLPDAATIFLSVTLLKGLSNAYVLTGLSQAWSLTVEEMFYLYAPVAFYLIKKKGVFLLQMPMLLATGFLLAGLASWFSLPNVFGGIRFLFADSFFGRCFEFFTGMYVALKLRNGVQERKGLRFTASGAFAFCFFLCVLAFYAQRESIDDINSFPFGVLVFNFLIPASFGLLFYGLVTESSWLKGLLATKPLTLLGKSSYAFYLLHIGFFAEVFYFHVTGNLLLLYLLLQLCSIAAYKFFEKPVYFYLLGKFIAFFSKTDSVKDKLVTGANVRKEA